MLFDENPMSSVEFSNWKPIPNDFELTHHKEHSLLEAIPSSPFQISIFYYINLFNTASIRDVRTLWNSSFCLNGISKNKILCNENFRPGFKNWVHFDPRHQGNQFLLRKVMGLFFWLNQAKMTQWVMRSSLLCCMLYYKVFYNSKLWRRRRYWIFYTKPSCKPHRDKPYSWWRYKTSTKENYTW